MSAATIAMSAGPGTAAVGPPTVSRKGGGVGFVIASACLFLAPLILAPAGLGGPVRVAYLGGAMLLAAIASRQSPARFVGLVVWLFLLSPFVRRYVDLGAGWQEVSPIMLAPYGATLFAAPAALDYVLRRGGPAATPFLLIGACVAYGLGVAVLGNRLVGGGFEALRWTVPPLLALYIMVHGDEADRITRALMRCFLVAVPLLGLYGLVQFVSPAPWDVFWMENAEINSIGTPEPMKVRVFATLNTPGALAVVLSGCTMFLMGAARRGGALAACFAVPALLLTMQRAVFAGTLVGLVFLAVCGTMRLRRQILVVGVVCSLAVTALFTIPRTQEMVAERLSSFTALDRDESAQDRMEQYRAFPEFLDEGFWGRGLGWEGTYTQADNQRRVVVDSGIISTFLIFGLPVGILYFGAVAVLALVLLRRSISSADPVMAACTAIVLSRLAELPLGGHHIAEHGVFLWVFLGLGLARSVDSREQAA